MPKAATPGPCRDCGEQQPKLSRERCPRCYTRWWKTQKKNGTFDKFSTVPSVLDRMRPRMSPQPNGCIHWTGQISKYGYGTVSVKGQVTGAHRVSFEQFVGPIPEGLWIDHMCHNGDTSCLGGNGCMHRRCVNPEHLKLATPRENQHRSHLTAASKTACVNGHPFTEENTYLRPDGKGRGCRTCTQIRARRQRKGKAPRKVLAFCKRGHEMTEENTYLYGNRRICRECGRESDRRRYWQKKDATS